MKNKSMIAIALVCAVLALAACGKGSTGGSGQPVDSKAEDAAEGTTENTDQIPNPWSETTDLEEAEKAAGIDFEPPADGALPEGYSLVTYRYTDSILEADYQKGEEEITIRVSKDLSGIDLSGDYTEYSKEWEENFKGLVVTCRGDGTLANCANADLDNIHFVVECNVGQEGKGLTADQLGSIFMGMQGVPLE